MRDCPVCREREGVRFESNGAVLNVDCGRCGNFEISSSLDAELAGGKHAPGSALIKGAVREATDRTPGIRFDTYSFADLVANARPPASPVEAAGRVIRYIGDRAETFASPVKIIAKHDYPIVYGKEAEDLGYAQVYLLDEKLIERAKTAAGGLRLTPKGWEHYHHLRSNVPAGNKAFVAMWFHPDMDDAWNRGFVPGLSEAGYDPVRVDLVEHNEKICDRILAEIRGASLVVADFTGDRGGVYFEAGFAMGLGIPVVWTARKSDFSAHFDTRQFNHILWDEPSDLASRLRDRVLGSIGRPGADL